MNERIYSYNNYFYIKIQFVKYKFNIEICNKQG